MPLPALSISSSPDVILGLPLDESHAKCITTSSPPAQGCKEEGNEAAPVCHSWKLPPSQFSINNSRWAKQLQILTNKVKDELLGCNPAIKVDCELSELALYETDGFSQVCVILMCAVFKVLTSNSVTP